MYRDGRSKTTRDRSVSPAPFASKNQPIGKISQSNKPPSATNTSSTQHKRSKVSKPPAKSKTTQEPNNSTGNSGPSKPVQTGSKSVSKGKKSQKFHSNYSAPPSQLDVQSSSYSKNSSVPAHPSETNSFNQSVNNPTTDTTKQTFVETSGSSSGSASSSSSDSSDSESESPLLQSAPIPLIVDATSGNGAGVEANVSTASMSGSSSVNVHSLQPTTRGIKKQLAPYYVYYTYSYSSRINAYIWWKQWQCSNLHTSIPSTAITGCRL